MFFFYLNSFLEYLCCIQRQLPTQADGREAGAPLHEGGGAGEEGVIPQ